MGEPASRHHRRTCMAFATAMTTVLWFGVGFAAPDINSATIQLYATNACSSLSVVGINEYPNSIVIADSCYGGSLTNGNRHIWRLSEDGMSAAVFSNADSFRFCADLRIARGFGTVGLQISPWWSPDLVGTFVVDLDYGWVVAAGGRLPYFAFVGQEYESLPPYVRGTTLHLEMVYLPNGLSQANPATIEYRVRYNSVNYTSGPLAFTEGNPSDDPPHGRWGILNNARVGGYMNFDTTRSGINYLLAEWSNICFEVLAAGVSRTEWSHVKQLYR